MSNAATYRIRIALEAVRDGLVSMKPSGKFLAPDAPEDIRGLIRVPWDRNQFTQLFVERFIEADGELLRITERGARELRRVCAHGHERRTLR